MLCCGLGKLLYSNSPFPIIEYRIPLIPLNENVQQLPNQDFSGGLEH